MNKTITYSGFALSSILIILVFLTAKTYTQLIIAVLLYPLIAYFALRLFPRKTQSILQTKPTVIIQPVKSPVRSINEVEDIDRGKVEIVDIEKRTFLKLLGTAGISFFLFSLLGRRVENLIFGGTLESGITKTGIIPNEQISESQPILSEGYRISEIDDNIISYYGFINKAGAWLIMKEDTETNSFRYVIGDSNFSKNWEKRENLKYDYYYNLF